MTRCERCNKPIKHIYQWNGQTVGRACYRKLNPFYSDPAQAVFIAAQAVLNGDKSPLRLLPGEWSTMPNYTNRAKNLCNLSDHGSKAYWLAIDMHNRVARQTFGMQKLWSIVEYKRFEES